ncbi:MAG: FecR family protein [Acidobacteriota bacterium]
MVLILVLALTLALAPAPVRSQSPGDPVGRMALVRNDVTGTPPGETAASALAVGDPVVLDHLIRTGRASAARMTLGSEGVLSLGQDVQLRVDRMVVDQATGRTESTLELLLGKIELALGSLFRGEVTVETPTASLGVKGTVLRVLVDAAGRTLVAVLEGTVEVTSKAGGTVTVRAGELTIVEEGAAPLPPSPFDPSAGTLSPSAGGPDFAVPGEDLLPESPLLDGQQIDLPREPPDRGQLGPFQESDGALDEPPG